INHDIPYKGGASSPYAYSASYSDLKDALANDAVLSKDDNMALTSLPTDSPAPGNIYLTSAQAKALGLFSGDEGAVDGGFGLSPVSSPDYWLSLGIHEIGHILGRMT